MLVRIVQFVLGALLAGGGGYLAWTHRAGAMNVFPPGADGMPWWVIAGVLGVSAGIVFLVSAVHPRPNRKARLAAEAAERDEALGAADAYYSERSKAADRDWRSGDIPAPVTPAPAPEPVRAAAPPPPAPPPVAPAPPAPVAPPPPAAAKPVATSAPPMAQAVTPFPSTATLAPIPKAAEPPPALAQAAPVQAAPEPAVAAAPVAAGSFPEIRAAIAQGRLDEADKMLNTEREKAQGVALAELTGLAGDHAEAAGRASHAKWLWRRALSRFGELNAMDAPAARAVAEKLRTAE